MDATVNERQSSCLFRTLVGEDTNKVENKFHFISAGMKQMGGFLYKAVNKTSTSGHQKVCQSGMLIVRMKFGPTVSQI